MLESQELHHVSDVADVVAGVCIHVVFMYACIHTRVQLELCHVSDVADVVAGVREYVCMCMCEYILELHACSW